MEKMLEEVKPVEAPAEEEFPVKKLDEKPWKIDTATGVKTCETCGFELRGWAFRQTFRYCPNCGEKKSV